MEKRKARRYVFPILRYPTRGSMRRKWNETNYNTPSSTTMFWLIFMISICNVHLCLGREIRLSVPGRGGILSQNFASHTHSIRGGGGGGRSNNTIASEALTSSDLVWVIERKECRQLDDGCFCESRSRNWTTIRCRCDNDTQVAHLKSPEPDMKESSLFVHKERWTWRFEQCSQLVLHSKFLGSVDGSHFEVEFHQISTLTVHESAFETRDSYSSHGNPNQVSILFSQCGIDRLPTRAFPSYVHSIRFVECNIKTVEKRFIYALTMDKVSIESSKIDDIESEAFYDQTIIDSLNVVNSTVLSIHTGGVASAISKMEWTNSEVDLLQNDALSGFVATVTFQNSLFANVETSGFSIKTWSKIILANNTFSFVARRGIDLSHSSESSRTVEIVDNSWGKVERDFITTGASENPFIRVNNNTFLQQCDCGNTFESYLTRNGSRVWFHHELLNNSRCPVSDQVLECLLRNGHTNTTESNWLPYDALGLLCDSEVFMCMNGVSEVTVGNDDIIPGTPQLPTRPNRLRVLAYFIGAMGVFIIASLLVTMCVFLCRRKTPRKKAPPDNTIPDLEHAQGKKTAMSKSLSGGEYADIVFKHQNGSGRPRSMLFEDVEMEDKGVQTMPTELSSEVLEGLREKLSRPDSFWDAKETIDHLYDLIQVKELNSALSSPPDVTMCNGQSTTASTARLLPSTSSSPVAQVVSAGVSVSIGGSADSPKLSCSVASNTSSPVSETPPPLPATSPPQGVPLLQRYAQIRNKTKTAPLCEYADPSDSSMHIYSELTPHLQAAAEQSGTSIIKASPSSNGKVASPSRELPSLKNSFLNKMRTPPQNGPILCEYTEPKDVQTHVYAELSNNPKQKPPRQSKSVSTSPSKPAIPQKKPVLLNNLNTITIAVPPPPINIPHSNSFHSSPRLLSKLRESELSSSNPSIATPVNIIHVSDLTAADSGKRFTPEKLKRSGSCVDATSSQRKTITLSPLLNDGLAGGNDTQKRPLPSIPSWSSMNEGKSQL